MEIWRKELFEGGGESESESERECDRVSERDRVCSVAL